MSTAATVLETSSRNSLRPQLSFAAIHELAGLRKRAKVFGITIVAFAILSEWAQSESPAELETSGTRFHQQPVADATEAEVDFDTEIIPLLTKSGCNAASCHGAASGRGGFRLSLFGGDPAFDFDEIVRALRGRRINLADPLASLILRKPTGEAEHQGGIRFEVDSEEAEILERWLEQGAPRIQRRQLESLSVSPAEMIADAPFERQAIQVVAHFDDGSQRDVTRWAVLTPDDPTAVSMTRNGLISVSRRGRFHLCVQYLSDQVLIPITIPIASLSDTANWPSTGRIDDAINRSLQQIGIMPTEGADHDTLVRRLSLTLTGRLPTPELLENYQDQHGDANYDRLVDELVESEAFTSYWTYRLLQALRVATPGNESEVTDAIYAWVYQHVAEDLSLLELAVEMVDATGDSHELGGVGLHRMSADARAEAEYFSEVFMGVRLRCANCHDHPLDRWKQDDYHGLAAIFAKRSRGRVAQDLPEGEVTHPRTRQAAIPKLPGERLDVERVVSRSDLADWIANEPDRHFARAMANRIWKSLFGQGLVESADDLRISNPVSHPQLLDELADTLIANDYRIRPLIREIACSATFRRASQLGSTAIETRFLGSFPITTFEPAIHLDAIAYVTGTDVNVDENRPQRWAVDLTNPAAPSETLDLLGRCPTSDGCVDVRSSNAMPLPTVLHLINGELINERITDPRQSHSKT